MKSVIKNYCAIEAPGYAIMINGNWGIGKTYFVKAYFDSLPTLKMIYVSLYGITDKYQIDDQIFSALIGNVKASDNEIKKAADLVGSVFSTFGDKTQGSAIGALASTAGGLIKSKALKNIGNDTVIVFDDLERADISPYLCMSKINEFVEHQKLKVIILCDEEKISDQKYCEYKEKVVLHTNHLERSLQEITDICFKTVGRFSDCSQVNFFKNQFLITLGQVKSNNLRTLVHGLSCFKTLVDKINSMDSSLKGNDIVADLLFPSLVLAIGYREYNVDLNSLKKIVTQLSDLSFSYYMTKEKDKDRKLTPLDKFYEEVVAKATKNIDFMSVFELVCKGHLSEEMLIDDMNRWDIIKRGNDYPITSFDHTSAISDEEFTLIVNKAYVILDDENYIFPNTAALFRFCKNFELFYSKNATSLCKGFRKKLRTFALSVCKNCQEHTEADHFGITEGENSFISKLHKSLNELSTKLVEHDNKVKSQKSLLDLIANQNLLALENSLRLETETEFLTIPFIENLLVEIEKTDAATLRILAIFIQKRYTAGYFFNKFKPEIPAIICLYEGIDMIISERSNSLSSMMLRHLTETLHEISKRAGEPNVSNNSDT